MLYQFKKWKQRRIKIYQKPFKRSLTFQMRKFQTHTLLPLPILFAGPRAMATWQAITHKLQFSLHIDWQCQPFAILYFYFHGHLITTTHLVCTTVRRNFLDRETECQGSPPREIACCWGHMITLWEFSVQTQFKKTGRFRPSQLTFILTKRG